jgi:hypothetical protein
LFQQLNGKNEAVEIEVGKHLGGSFLLLSLQSNAQAANKKEPGIALLSLGGEYDVLSNLFEPILESASPLGGF